MTFSIKQIAAAALLVAGAAAQALPSVSTIFTPGVQNTLSDDFVEIIIDGSTGTPRVGGNIQVGDFLISSLAMTSYAPNATPANAVKELSLFAVSRVNSITALPIGACLTAVLPGGCASFDFGAAGAATFNTLFSAFGGSSPIGLPITNSTIAVFFEDDNHDFSVTNFASGLDGTARMVVDLVADNGDSWSAVGPLSPAGFLANPVGKGIGSFSIDGTITAQSFAGWNIDSDITARGNLSRLPAGAASPLGGDASFFITPNRVPEPAGLGLAAVALLGMGAASARRRKN